jgi:hypothetical protein
MLIADHVTRTWLPYGGFRDLLGCATAAPELECTHC